MTVRIELGWNNVVYFGAQRPVSEVIAEFGGAVTRVFVWEGASQSWRSYHAALPAFLSDPEFVTPYMSLRLLNEGAVTTWTQTAAPVARTVPLSAGWNSVGWTGEDGVPLGDAFGDLEAANALVWDPLGQAYDAFATAAPPFLNTLDSLDFGNAVWVLVPDAQEWRMGGVGIITRLRAVRATGARPRRRSFGPRWRGPGRGRESLHRGHLQPPRATGGCGHRRHHHGGGGGRGGLRRRRRPGHGSAACLSQWCGAGRGREPLYRGRAQPPRATGGCGHCVITTVAGTGERGFGGDGGPATAALLAGPVDVALDGAGNLFIADGPNHRVRRVDAATGVITTVAGTGEGGFGGDGGPATAAQLGFPSDVALDGAGNLFIASGGRVRRVDAATGIITTVAGTGERARR